MPPRAPGARRAARRALRAAARDLALLFFVPFIWTVSTSFKTLPDSVGFNLLPHPWTTAAWKYVWTQYDFKRYIAQQPLPRGRVTAANLVLGALGGYAFARLRFPGREVLFLPRARRR